MSVHFKHIVIGRGMMGAAAAKYLARQTDGVAVIGPDEPQDAKTHQGVFASHYDEARITRTIDPDADWALMANRSIARYGDIERESGVEFYAPVGCLVVGPKRGGGNPFIQNICNAAAKLNVETQLLSNDALAKDFSYFAFEAGCEGVFEAKNAGYVNPRALVKAQSTLAEKAGVTVLREVAVSVRDEGTFAVVTTAEGNEYRADNVLVAAGGFSIMEGLLPQPVKLNVYKRTVTFFEIPEDELDAYSGMPSLIYEPSDPSKHIYMLPPVRYPDGKVYLKIGGDPDDKLVSGDADMREWFRSGGRQVAQDHLTAIVASLVPSVDLSRVSTGACVVSKTPGGYPAIGFTSSPRIALLTGGCGTAAKSSDEIGRLGATLVREGQIDDAAYVTDFKPAFATM